MLHNKFGGFFWEWIQVHCNNEEIEDFSLQFLVSALCLKMSFGVILTVCMPKSSTESSLSVWFLSTLVKTVYSSVVYLIILPVIFLPNFQVEFLFH